jgi:pimeloyl-ACP methyl ester carboxylesterase
MLAVSDGNVDESLAALRSLVSATDRAALTPEFAAFRAARTRHSIGQSIWGWFDYDIAEMKPSGFDAGSIRVPVSIWYREEDNFVPRAHADWLIANVPGASSHILPGEGHWSIKEAHLDDILDALLAAEPDTPESP